MLELSLSTTVPSLKVPGAGVGPVLPAAFTVALADIAGTIGGGDATIVLPTPGRQAPAEGGKALPASGKGAGDAAADPALAWLALPETSVAPTKQREAVPAAAPHGTSDAKAAVAIRLPVDTGATPRTPTATGTIALVAAMPQADVAEAADAPSRPHGKPDKHDDAAKQAVAVVDPNAAAVVIAAPIILPPAIEVPAVPVTPAATHTTVAAPVRGDGGKPTLPVAVQADSATAVETTGATTKQARPASVKPAAPVVVPMAPRQAGVEQRVGDAPARAVPMPPASNPPVTTPLTFATAPAPAVAPSPAPPLPAASVGTPTPTTPAVPMPAPRHAASEPAPASSQPDSAPQPARPVPAPAAMRPAPRPTAAPAGMVFGIALAAGTTPGNGADRASPRDQALQALTAIAGAGPAMAAVAPAGNAAHGTLDMRRDDWPQAMIDHIEALRDAADATSTRLRLMPDALGKVDVSLRHDGNTVHVHFAADVPATRALIADAQPRLADLAQARGIRLGQASVDAGAAGQGGQQQQAFTHQPQPARPAPVMAATTVADSPDSTRLA